MHPAIMVITLLRWQRAVSFREKGPGFACSFAGYVDFGFARVSGL